MHNEELDSETLFPMVVKTMNYSDTRMAAIVYYTMSQLEDDPILLEKFRRGADCWWRLEKYGRDIEWSLVYQLMYPDEEKYDAFGRPCKDVLAWQASRYPVSSREIFIDNTTRPDAREEDGMLWYKDTEKPMPLQWMSAAARALISSMPARVDGTIASASTAHTISSCPIG